MSTLVSTGAVADQTAGRRLAVRLHLLMCRRCRAFERQVRALTRLARHASRGFPEEPSADFEAALVERLRKHDSGTPPA